MMNNYEEKSEVSSQEVKVFLALRSAGSWATNKDLATASKVPLRTVSFKTKKFVEIGLCDQAEVFPAHRYRLSEKASKRNASYMKRIEQALEVFGESL